MKRWRTDGFARRCLVAGALALFAAAAVAGEQRHGILKLLTEAPRSFSRAGLDRVGDYIRNEIATGKIPGAILLIQQHGKPVYFENFGVRDVATKLPTPADRLFPISW